MMRCLALLFTLLISACGPSQEGKWPNWERFKTDYIHEGRVIDSSDPRQITTSEGQSYALFFALVANDPLLFEQLLQWTEINLAQGDLTKHLPSWLWGQSADKHWGVLDNNNASDADLWLAYDLIEAGRLWNKPAYNDLGMKLLAQIAHEDITDLPGLGVMLLPWKKDPTQTNNWSLNPSYSPPQLLQRFSVFGSPWQALNQNTPGFLINTSPQGLAPDWIIWDIQKGWLPNTKNPNRGSYDAIRVYLWVGMMANGSQHKAQLTQHFRPMISLTANAGFPPRIIQTDKGSTSGDGPPGFSAALLPLLSDYSLTLILQRQRVVANPFSAGAYFDSSLRLFGQGWDEERYRFDKEGLLIPQWSQIDE